MNASDDLLSFCDEPAPSDVLRSALQAPMLVLVVDDEPMVHAVTAMVLEGLLCNRRPVELLHSYSASEARAIMREHDDIALILLDVMMETDSAGLDLARDIRQGLMNREVRIVLRTGQPGQDFDSSYMNRFDISAYYAKTDMTRQQLIATVLEELQRYSRLS